MGLQNSGSISIGDIATEFGDTAPHSMSEFYGAASGVPSSGAIRVGQDFYGKSSLFQFTISAATTDANLATLATAAGWDGTAALEATIASGVYVSGSTTANYGMTISGSFPAGVTLINNGYILGDGGSGGKGGDSPNCLNNQTGGTGGLGGTALVANVACTVDNTNGVIGGGGGGGGGGGAGGDGNYDPDEGFQCGYTAGGGGGGGGQSGNVNSPGGGYGNGSRRGNAGNAGTKTAAGTYGNGGSPAGRGGNGGNWGSSGGSGTGANGCPSGVPCRPGGAGGSGGAATSGISNITWTATGTRYGTLG